MKNSVRFVLTIFLFILLGFVLSCGKAGTTQETTSGEPFQAEEKDGEEEPNEGGLADSIFTPTATQGVSTNPSQTPEAFAPIPTDTPVLPSTTLDTDLPYDYLEPPVGVSSYKQMPLIPQPKKQINVLVLGSDHFEDRKGYRTDAIMLVTINTKKDIVSVTSFPRDLWVYIPGWTVQRINTAYPYGGFESLADTMEYNFGVRPDYYAFIHVSFLEEVVDTLGGITVQVEKTLCDHRSEYNGTYCVYPGEYVMDGATAFWYAKSRNTSENDFGRNRRHQELLRGVFDRVLELKFLTKIPKLYKTYKNNVETNLGLGILLKLASTASKLEDETRITQYFISQDDVINWTTSGGAQVLIPQPKPIREILFRALNNE